MAPSSSISSILFGSEGRTTLSLFGGVTILGLGLGIIVPGSSSLRDPWRFWSNLIGWMYFAAWSVSFWPQVILIHRRRHVSGLSFDFLALNLLGFSCYSAYNIALYTSATVRAQYAIAHPASTSPAVELNDVFFGLHAIFATLISILQCLVYPRDAAQKVTRTGTVWLAILSTSLLIYAGVVAVSPDGCTAATGGSPRGWLAFFTFVSYVKLAISLTKYAPQVYLNCSLKSTVGWSIHNVLLDFTGGLLSVLQLIGDANQRGWDVVIGDPVKFGLGLASMLFDVIFFTQHYFLYSGARDKAAGEGEGARDNEYAESDDTGLLSSSPRGESHLI